MKDRKEMLYDFWSSFGLPAYEENSVPEDATYPRITYEASEGGFDAVLSLSASIWDRTNRGTAFIDAKADEIEEYIKNMGCPKIKGGRFRAFTDGIYCQTMNDPEDRLLKRNVLTVYFEFMTD